MIKRIKNLFKRRLKNNHIYIGGSAAIEALKLQGFHVDIMDHQNNSSFYMGYIFTKPKKRIIVFYQPHFDNMRLFSLIDTKTRIPKASSLLIDITKKVKRL